jgi:transposase-like protein
VSWKDARAVVADLRLIYRAASREDADRQLAAFEAA